jgi:hypothetical protein
MRRTSRLTSLLYSYTQADRLCSISITMSTKNVVLVLGNDAFASRVAELARDAGNIVTLAAPDAKGLDKWVHRRRPSLSL